MLARTFLLLAVLLAPTAAAAAEVELTSGAFEPDVVTIEAGEEVVWTNVDGRGHTVTSSWDEGATFDEVLTPGESFRWTFEEPGEYAIHCVPHSTPGADGAYSGMVMTVRVVAPHEDAQRVDVPAAPPLPVLAALAALALVARRTRRP